MIQPRNIEWCFKTKAAWTLGRAPGTSLKARGDRERIVDRICIARRLRLWLLGTVSPVVTGDAPTADQQTFEWYLGGGYQESESG
jgi:hypothetical protein